MALLAVAGLVDRLWQKRKHRNDLDVATKIEEVKTELMGHVTANRIQSDRLTRRTAENLQQKMDEGQGILLEMMSDLETKVTKSADTKKVRTTKETITIEKVPI